jgi:hypothetical protein
MAFKDVFEQTRNKLNNYFGIGQPGLGKFGSQVVNPIRNATTNKIANFAVNSPKLNLIDRAGKNQIVRGANQIGVGVTDVARQTAGAVNRYNNSRINRFIGLPGAISTVGRIERPAQRFVQNNPANTKIEKAGRFIGQNLPSVIMPSSPGITAAKVASPTLRLLANSGLRGAENAAFNAASRYANNERITPRNVAKDVATGGLINAGLSPKLSIQAGKELIRNTKAINAQKELASYLGDFANRFSRTNYRPSVNKLIDEFQYTKNLTPQVKKAIGNLLEQENDPKRVFDILKNQIPQDINVNYYKPGTQPGFARIPAKPEETRPLIVKTEKNAAPQVVDWPKDKPIPASSTAREIGSLDQDQVRLPVLRDRIPSGEISQSPGLGVEPTSTQSLSPIKSTDQIDNVKSSFADTIQRNYTDVKSKINILDYLRTPDRVLKKIGLGKETDYLRDQFTKYQQELPKEIEKITKWSEQVTPEGNVRIFNWLDGQKVDLPQNELKVANEIKSYLSEWADRLNLPEDRRISNYITHIFEKDLKGAEFPDDLAKIIQDKVAGSVYDPFTMERLGKKGYVEDTFRALEAYVKRATRKANLDPALEQIKNASDDMELSQFNYVKNFIDRVNMRPTEKDTLVDNFIKSAIGYRAGQRPFASITKQARQWVYRGTLGLNASSALKNLSQGANTYAKLGEKYTAKGYFDLFKNWQSDELQRVGVLADDFIQDKNLSYTKRFMDKADKGLFFLFETAEKINRGAAYYGAKAKYLKEGLNEEEAIKKAVALVRDTQFKFGSIDTPPILQSDLGKTLGQFQSFSLKQAEFLGEMITNKEWAGLARWTGASLLFVYSIGKMFGMEPKDIIPTVRTDSFLQPPILQPLIKTGEVALGIKGEYGQDQTYKDVAKSAVKYIPGGVQGKKTIEGILSYNKGASTTAKGEERYKIPQTSGNLAKVSLFGQYSTNKAREYFKNKEMSKEDKEKKSKLSEREIGQGIKITQNDKGETEYKVTIKGKERTYSDPVDASDASRKEILRKSGKNIKQYGDKIYRLQSGGDVSVTTKDEYTNSLYTNKRQKAKRNNDYKTWLDFSNKQLDLIEKQLQDPTLDELEQSDLLEKAEIILDDMEKYGEYGGFKKPKKIKGISSSPSDLTIKMPIRQAKKPVLKTVSSTPKIAVKSPTKKLISKSTLSKLR